MKQGQATKEFDVLIVGAGIVGLVLGGLCAQKGLSVGIVDRQFPVMPLDKGLEVPEAYRAWVSALSPSSLHVLHGLGLGAMLDINASPYLTMQVVFGGGQACHFSHQDVGTRQLGMIINNYLLRSALWQHVDSLEGSVQMVTGQPEAWYANQGLLHLDDGRVLQTKLLAGADGVHSWVREAIAVSLVRDRDIKDHAYIGRLVHPQAHAGCARQVFDHVGVIGLLPGSDPNRTVFVWSSDAQSHSQSDAHASEHYQKTLLSALKKSFSSMDYRCEGRWRHHRIHSQMATRYTGPRTVLLGDAACAVHPLAGQGLNIGLRQARLLSESLHEATRSGEQNSYDSAAVRYAQKARGYDDLSRQAYRACRHMMQPQMQPYGLLHKGMAMFGKSQWIRRMLIEHAMQNDARLSV